MKFHDLLPNFPYGTGRSRRRRRRMLLGAVGFSLFISTAMAGFLVRERIVRTRAVEAAKKASQAAQKSDAECLKDRLATRAQRILGLKALDLRRGLSVDEAAELQILEERQAKEAAHVVAK